MFSGIVEGRAEVIQHMGARDTARLVAVMPFDCSDVSVGDSIAVQGVCLTAVAVCGRDVSFEISSETLRCTTLGRVKAGDRLHVERSAKVGERLHGHFVTGHIDAVASVVDVGREGQTLRIRFELPHQIRSLVTPKGAVSVDGVSLTVGEVGPDWFQVYIVPHTGAVTRFGELCVHDAVNIEADILARYVQAGLNMAVNARKVSNA